MSDPDDGRARLLARARDDVGELALRARDGVVELVVDGVFAMDSAHTTTEQALAALTLDRLAGNGLQVVVGGLGLGYTCQALLASPRVAAVTVVELHRAVVDWVRGGLVPSAAGLLDDPRVRVVVGDVLDVVPALPAAGADAVLLDVDNGPDFLVHPGNAAVYTHEFLTACARAIRPGGAVAIWSADPAPGLATALADACGSGEECLLDVERDGRAFSYAIYLGRLTRA